MNQSPQTKQPRIGRYAGMARTLLSTFDENRVFVDLSKIGRTDVTPSVVDLFAGAGGMSLGFQQAGYRIKSAVEIVEIACATHERNFPNTTVFCGDVADFRSQLDPNSEKTHLVIGGPPCQGFSVAGKRDPNDPRNRLFEEFVRVVRDLQPDYFVMENVPGILTMSGGRVRDAILEAFEEIGYPGVSIAILEAADYGVPQFRSRAIFIGNRHGWPNPFPAPVLSPSGYRSIETALEGLPEWETIPELNHEWTKHSKKFEERISKVLPGGSLYETFSDAYKRQYSGVPSMTIKENHGGTHIHPHLNRCISAREMARLQSFPDSFIFEGTMKKAMWQIGNAVPPKLAESVGQSLMSFVSAGNANRPPQFERKILEGEATSGLPALF